VRNGHNGAPTAGTYGKGTAYSMRGRILLRPHHLPPNAYLFAAYVVRAEKKRPSEAATRAMSGTRSGNLI